MSTKDHTLMLLSDLSREIEEQGIVHPAPTYWALKNYTTNGVRLGSRGRVRLKSTRIVRGWASTIADFKEFMAALSATPPLRERHFTEENNGGRK